MLHIVTLRKMLGGVRTESSFENMARRTIFFQSFLELF